MAISLHDDNSQRGDAVQEILKAGCGLTAVKPKVNDVTIVRFIPEQGPDGNPLPMVTGFDANGPLFSNLTVEPLVLFAGTMGKFHGLVRPGDPGLHDMPDSDLPFSGLYIKLKGDMNKNRVAQDQYMTVNELLKKPANGSAPLSQVQDHALGQVCVIQLNGKPCNPPDVKRVVVLGKSAKMALTACLMKAAQDKVDLFDPKTGWALKIYGTPKVGNSPQNFIVEPAFQCEIPEAAWKGNWVNWDAALKRYSYDELIHKMVAAYGAGVVSMKPSYKEAMDRLGIRYGTVSYTPAAAPGAAPAAQAPVMGGWGAPAAPTPASQPAHQPAPANGGWGMPAAAAPQPAFQAAPAPATMPSWASPSMQTQTPPPAVQPIATGAVGDVADLEKAFQAELEKHRQQPQAGK